MGGVFLVYLHLRNIPHHWPENLKITLFDIGCSLQAGECSKKDILNAMWALNVYLNAGECTEMDVKIIDALSDMFIHLIEVRDEIFFNFLPDGSVSSALANGLRADHLVNDLCKQCDSTPEIVDTLIWYQSCDPHLLERLLSSTSYDVFKGAIQSNLDKLFYYHKCEILKAAMKHHRDEILDEMLPGWEMHTPTDLKEGEALFKGIDNWCTSLALDDKHAIDIAKIIKELIGYAVNEVRNVASFDDFIEAVNYTLQPDTARNDCATKKKLRFSENPVATRQTYECDLSRTTRYPEFKSTRKLIDFPSPS